MPPACRSQWTLQLLADIYHFATLFCEAVPRNLSSGQRMAFPIRIEQLLVGQHAAQHLAQTI